MKALRLESINKKLWSWVLVIWTVTPIHWVEYFLSLWLLACSDTEWFPWLLADTLDQHSYVIPSQIKTLLHTESLSTVGMVAVH